MRRSGGVAEEELRRRSRRLGLQIAGVVTALVATVMGLGVLLYEDAEHDAAEDLLREAVTYRADDLPPGFWMYVERDGTGEASGPDFPGLPATTELTLVAGDGRSRQIELDAAGRTYFVRTVVRDGELVQVAVDRTEAEQSSGRLMRAALAAGLVGAVVAGFLGMLIARRVFAPVTEALTMQRRFVADASHELRTPVTLLATRAQLLLRKARRDESLPPDVRADLEGLVEDSRALTGVLEGLLDAAEPGATLARTPVDVTDLVRGVVAAARPQAEERGLVLQSGRIEPLVLDIAEPAVRRALVALLDNALDHAASQVTLDVHAHARRVDLAVSDDGPGVTEATAARMFDRFASNRNEATSERRHYGLGLALVSDVAEAHGGRVRVAPRTGGGTTIVMTLPR